MSHSWSQLGIGQDFFFLSLYTRESLKYTNTFFFPVSTRNNSCYSAAQLHSVELTIANFVFSLYIHTWHMSPLTSLSLFSSLSPLFSPPLPVVTKTLLWLSLSTTLHIALAVSLSTYCYLWLSLRISLSSSLHTHTSHFLSPKRFIFLTINLQ